jgi:hypothetical protein
MQMQQMWHQLDKQLQDRFHGHYGLAAFREVVILIFMVRAHKMLKAKLPPDFLPALELGWYGSLLPYHPLHAVRNMVQHQVADWAVGADDYFQSPLQKKFSYLDGCVPRMEQYIDGLLAPRPSARR